MSDLKKFIRLYKGFGITVNPIKTIPGQFVIVLREGEQPMFKGDKDHSSHIVFDKDGKFLLQDFWGVDYE